MFSIVLNEYLVKNKIKYIVLTLLFIVVLAILYCLGIHVLHNLKVCCCTKYDAKQSHIFTCENAKDLRMDCWHRQWATHTTYRFPAFYVDDLPTLTMYY
jgi:hypothetical protein